MTTYHRIPNKEVQKWYSRTPEDIKIIDEHIDKYIDALLGITNYKGKNYGKAFNAIFRDYDEILPWLVSLKEEKDHIILIPGPYNDKYGC